MSLLRMQVNIVRTLSFKSQTPFIRDLLALCNMPTRNNAVQTSHSQVLDQDDFKISVRNKKLNSDIQKLRMKGLHFIYLPKIHGGSF